MISQILKRIEQADARIYWTGVFLAALGVRIVFFCYWNSLHYTEILGYDPYISVAEYWLGWKPPMVDIMLSPGYSFFLAVLFWILGRSSVLAARLVNIVMSSFTCMVAGWWALSHVGWRRSNDSQVPARLLALWMAVDPALITFSVQPQSETFFILWEMLFFWALAKNWHQRPGLSFAQGLIGGFVSMIRSVFAPYLALFCGALFLRESKTWRNFGLLCLLAAGWMFPISLWTARNYSKYHVISPLSAQSGWNLYEGFSLDREEIRRRPVDMGEEIKQVGIQDPIAASKYFQAKTLRFMRDNPGQALKIILGKGIKFWRPWPYDPYGPGIRKIMGIYFSLLFVLALAGAWARRAAWRNDLPIYALILSLTLVHSFFFTSLRYRTPLEPFLCFFAGIGLIKLLSPKT